MRMLGVEPSPRPWKGRILPIYYIRISQRNGLPSLFIWPIFLASGRWGIWTPNLFHAMEARYRCAKRPMESLKWLFPTQIALRIFLNGLFWRLVYFPFVSMRALFWYTRNSNWSRRVVSFMLMWTISPFTFPWKWVSGSSGDIAGCLKWMWGIFSSPGKRGWFRVEVGSFNPPALVVKYKNPAVCPSTGPLV